MPEALLDLLESPLASLLRLAWDALSNHKVHVLPVIAAASLASLEEIAELIAANALIRRPPPRRTSCAEWPLLATNASKGVVCFLQKSADVASTILQTKRRLPLANPGKLRTSVALSQPTPSDETTLGVHRGGARRAILACALAAGAPAKLLEVQARIAAQLNVPALAQFGALVRYAAVDVVAVRVHNELEYAFSWALLSGAQGDIDMKVGIACDVDNLQRQGPVVEPMAWDMLQLIRGKINKSQGRWDQRCNLCQRVPRQVERVEVLKRRLYLKLLRVAELL